jgi:ABC-2 type transport system permease protein
VIEGSQIALQHRQLVHNAWDLPKTATLDPFYQLYPQWQHTPPVTGRFHWKWYFAFQHMADVRLDDQVRQRELTLRQRDERTAFLGYFLPSVWAQHQLEAVAESNVNHLLQHRQQITAFHRQLRHYLYPFLFEDMPFKASDFGNLPKFNHATSSRQCNLDC